MALPHYTNVKPAQNLEEPLYLNLFDVQFQLPPAINGGETLTTFAKTVNLPLHPALEEVVQRYKYSTRSYTSFPADTSAEFSITFNVNVNDANSAYVFKTLTELYKLSFNPATGEMTRKIDHVATITVDIHNKLGEILRRVVLKDCELRGIDEMSLDWESADAFEVSTTWKTDHWDDLIV